MDHPYLVALLFSVILLFSIFIGQVCTSIAYKSTNESSLKTNRSPKLFDTQASNPDDYSSQKPNAKSQIIRIVKHQTHSQLLFQTNSESQRYLNNNSSDYYRDSQMRNLENEIEAKEKNQK